MACAHAKVTGQIGVCMVTSGPRAIHALNGVYDAKMDHQPVLAIVGQQPTVGLGADTQQEINLSVLMGAVAETLRALIPLLHKKEDRSWRQEIKQNVTEWPNRE